MAASTGSWKWVEEQGYYRFQVAPEAAFMARQPKPVVEPPDVVRLKNISAIGHPEGMAGLRREGSVSKAEITAARAELRRRGLIKLWRDLDRIAVLITRRWDITSAKSEYVRLADKP